MHLMTLTLIERKEVHVYQAQMCPHRATIEMSDGEFLTCVTSIESPKTREDWIFFAAVAKKIQELCPNHDGFWQVESFAEKLSQLEQADAANRAELEKE